MRDLKPCTPPNGIFKGVNFMTPNVLGYYKLPTGYGYAELSEGRGIENEPIFGVTVRKGNGQHHEPEASRLFHDKTKALDYIRGLPGTARAPAVT